MIPIKPIEEEYFKIKPIENGLEFIGKIRMEKPQELLTPLFEETIEYIKSNSIKLIEFDLTKLEFLNSSGIRCFTKFILDIRSYKECRLNLLYKNEGWQKLSIPMLAKLGSGIVELIAK